MKKIILYAFTHGATREIDLRIADKILDAAVHVPKIVPIPSIEDFDCVILGS